MFTSCWCRLPRDKTAGLSYYHYYYRACTACLDYRLPSVCVGVKCNGNGADLCVLYLMLHRFNASLFFLKGWTSTPYLRRTHYLWLQSKIIDTDSQYKRYDWISMNGKPKMVENHDLNPFSTGVKRRKHPKFSREIWKCLQKNTFACHPNKNGKFSFLFGKKQTFLVQDVFTIAQFHTFNYVNFTSG